MLTHKHLPERAIKNKRQYHRKDNFNQLTKCIISFECIKKVGCYKIKKRIKRNQLKEFCVLNNNTKSLRCLNKL